MANVYDECTLYDLKPDDKFAIRANNGQSGVGIYEVERIEDNGDVWAKRLNQEKPRSHYFETPHLTRVVRIG